MKMKMGVLALTVGLLLIAGETAAYAIFCPQCGANYGDDIKFCPHDGTNLSAFRASSAATGDQNPSQRNPSTSSTPGAGSGQAAPKLPAGFTAVSNVIDLATGFPQRIRHDATNYELVLIPAGEFTMGITSDQANAEYVEMACKISDYDRRPSNRASHFNAVPQHKVSLDAFYMGVTEISNAQFRKFDPAHNSGEKFNPDEYPVTAVTWARAVAFCSWAGMRLPTEAEWEKAARGTDGRAYPWGNEFSMSSRCNVADATSRRQSDVGGPRTISSGYNDGYAYTAPVSSFPEGASPYGMLNMAGNVSEWCSDFFDNTYYSNSPTNNPPGGSTTVGGIMGVSRVVRGGSFRSMDPCVFKTTFRDFMMPAATVPNYGFRCALSIPRVN